MIPDECKDPAVKDQPTSTALSHQGCVGCLVQARGDPYQELYMRLLAPLIKALENLSISLHFEGEDLKENLVRDISHHGMSLRSLDAGTSSEGRPAQSVGMPRKQLQTRGTKGYERRHLPHTITSNAD